ncbi:deoxyribonuclease IV [Bacillus horti]|uniref:Deoxyribonuclease-4 n=1 Tax=Caldalkalibacillus horti TaxID=77523 RepID=A0ABT9W2S5_9BACI|nr:deoxyribonuclease IV [Bacillus horti]MDQ0167372.1 deoxyribonuclease-4 [Bacillus horti]
MKLGCHVSIKEGFLAAAKRALSFGAKSFQYFPKNPRSLSVKNINDSDALACAHFCKQHNLVSFAHTPYPTKLCPTTNTSRELIQSSLLNDLEIAEHCGSVGVIVHFGQSKERDRLAGYKQMINLLNEVLEQWKGEALLLIENNAGQGSRMGITLEEMVQIRTLTSYPEKIGFCLDTCHAFASGLWNGQTKEPLITDAKKLNYLENLKVIHLNDSVYPFRSYRDRHACLGDGKIELNGFIDLLSCSELQNTPFVLETPYTSTYTYKDQIEYITGLVEN